LSNISKEQPLFGDGQKRSLVDRLFGQLFD